MNTTINQHRLPVVNDAAIKGPTLTARGNLALLDEPTRNARRGFRVALVSMPFQWVRTPSIQLGLLSAIAESHGFPTQTFHLGLDCANRVGYSLYEELSQVRRRIMGDWFFSNEAFPEDAPDRDARFLDDFADDAAMQLGKEASRASSAYGALRNRLTILRIRNEVIPAYLHAMATEIDWGQYSVVGFSCVFQQTVASIALARRIRQLHPHVRLVFGGSNLDDEMGLELARKSPIIDHAVIGEADVAFPELLIALSEGRGTVSIPSVTTRTPDGGLTFGGNRPLFDDMNSLPTPRFTEYFERAEATGLMPRSKVRQTPIPFESARGCWWGAKHHCTFCGLNSNGLRFRSKSPERVAAELAELARATGSCTFTAVDNIVDTDYLKTLFPHIVDEGKDYKLFYEVKSNLSREQIRSLHLGGVTAIQPGIESLSTNVLRLMRKGVTAAQNVNTLRWARYYGIMVSWGVLWGFPGETEADYAEQTRLAGHLAHLQPPNACGVRIRMDRFSPLFFDDGSFPVEYKRADASYSYVYPSSFELDKLAYFFEYKLRESLDDSAYVSLGAALQAWTDAWADSGTALRPAAAGDEESGDKRRAAVRHKPTLTFSYSDSYLQIADFRKRIPVVQAFEGPLAELYRAASDRPITVDRCMELSKVNVPRGSIERALNEFCERGLMMKDGDKFLSLALPATPGR